MKRKVRTSCREPRLQRAISEALEPRTLLSASLQFVHAPSSGIAGGALGSAIEVELVNGPTNDTNPITLSITLSNGNATTATLGGTTTEDLTQGLVSGSSATIATFPSNLFISEAGSYTLTATDAADGVSVSDTPVAISAVATTTTITSSANPATAGNDVTLTFTVTSNSSVALTPAGYVSISDTNIAHDTSLLLNSSGQATLVVFGGLPVGSDTFTASYQGDPTFVGSTSSPFVQSTVQYATTTTITSSANPATNGNDLTLTFTVASTTSGIGTPAGNVNVTDSGLKYNTSIPLTNGVGTLIIYGGLPVGSDTFTAVYQGDSAFLTSTGTLKQNTVQYATTTTITSSANPATNGNDLTLTFTVASTTQGVGTPAGYVAIADTMDKYTTNVQLFSGVGTLVIYGGLPLGTDTFSASYLGDPAFLSSTAVPFAQVTKQYATTTTVTSSANPATNGDDLTLTFTVTSNTSGIGTPAGNVNVTDSGGKYNNTSIPLTNGVGTLIIYGGLAVGSDTFTANYQGDAAFLTSTGTLKQNTVQYATTTTITSSANPATNGNDLTLTFTVASTTQGVGTPAGYVAITDTTTKYDTNVQLFSGVGTLVIYGGLPLGSDTFTANYLGDPAFLSSTATPLVQSTVQYATTTTITPSANPAINGNDLTLTFTVTSNTPGIGIPAGNVNVTDSGLKYNTNISLNNAGVGTFTIYGGLAVGSDTFTAVYQGDSAFLSSTGKLVQQTVQYATTTTITSSANPATNGDDLILTFTVASTTPGVGMPAGYVAIADTTTKYDTNVALNSSGVGTQIIYGGLALGSDTFTASYLGDPEFLSSTATPLVQSTVRYATTTTITSSANPANAGNDLTLTFSVASTTSTADAPAGYVQITDSDGTVNTSLQINDSGKAFLTLYGGAPAGGDTFTAQYQGDPGFLASTGTLIQTTEKNETTAPTITWGNPADMTYGTALSATQLDAKANVAGTFVYTPAAGTILSAGSSQTLSVVFTPTDTKDYSVADATARINVLKATPVVTWANPADITAGTALGATQLDAKANITGTFVYTPAAGTVLSAGSGQTLSVVFTPDDTADYNVVDATAQINVVTVLKATPLVSWANPADITYGTALGSKQLDAKANVPGTFVYTPVAGTVLGAGEDQMLTVTFTPTNTTLYSVMQATAQINVKPVALTVVASAATQVYGAANPTFTDTITGFVNGDTQSVISGAAALTTVATSASPVGKYAITATIGSLSASNYTFTVYKNSTLTVTKAMLTVTANDASRTFGAANPKFTGVITGFVNGDSASVVSGSAALTTHAAAASAVGGYAITAAKGSLSAANYSFTTFVSGTLTITPASLTVTANAATMVYGAANPTLTYTITGFMNHNTAKSVVTGTATLATTATSASPVGGYDITAAIGSLSASNYSFNTFNAGTLSVTKALLTVTADPATKVYGTANPTFTDTITGFVNGDTASVVSGTAALTTKATTSSPVGNYVITAAIGDLSATNYSFPTFKTGTLSITKASLTVTADDASKIQGAANPRFTYAITGFVNGDGMSAVSGAALLTTLATADSPAGMYTITVALGKLSAKNYLFTEFDSGTLTVT